MAAGGPIPWRRALVVGVVVETSRARSLILDVPDWPGHLPGQHVDVRLTADDGYQTQRSYSIASAPEASGLSGRVTITVERLEGGEVSSYLADEVRAGDALELRGPIGGHFVWTVSHGGPLMLIAGGSGIVPLMAMLRHRSAAGGTMPARLLYSVQTIDDAIYRDELSRLAAPGTGLALVYTFTKQAPPGWNGFARRIDRALLEAVSFAPAEQPQLFVCGPTPMVEATAAALVALGHSAERVKTERFGPSGALDAR